MISGYFRPDQGKNDNYRDGAHTLMRIVNIQAVIIFALTLVLAFYLGTQKSHDRFFAETNEGKAMQMASLPLPNMGRMALSDWVAGAVSQIMTFGFNDVDARFAMSRKDFTAEGWDKFRRGVIASHIIDNMMQAQQIVTSVSTDVPVLKQEGLIDGRYSWVFDVPLLVTFHAGGVEVTRSKTVHLTIERLPTGENPNGVGISAWDMY